MKEKLIAQAIEFFEEVVKTGKARLIYETIIRKLENETGVMDIHRKTEFHDKKHDFKNS